MMNSVFLLATLAAACDAGWISSIVRNIPDAADSAAKAAKNAPWDDISFTALDVAGHASQQQQQAAPSKPTREMFSILFRKVGRVECADMPPAACANPTEYLSRADPTACNDTYVNTLDNTVLSVTSNVSCLGLTPADLPCPSCRLTGARASQPSAVHRLFWRTSNFAHL
jgi:hypothetical protein